MDRDRECLAGEIPLPGRIANALWDAFSVGRSPPATTARSLTCAATATADPGAATAAGLLEAHGQRRGRRYLPAPGLYARVARQIGVRAEDDPVVTRRLIVRRLTDRHARSSEIATHTRGEGRSSRSVDGVIPAGDSLTPRQRELVEILTAAGQALPISTIRHRLSRDASRSSVGQELRKLRAPGLVRLEGARRGARWRLGGAGDRTITGRPGDVTDGG